MSKPVYRIQSRISPAFNWRYVTNRLHAEPYKFDAADGRIRFDDLEEADRVCLSMSAANGAEFRVVEDSCIAVTRKIEPRTDEDPAVVAYDILTKTRWGEVDAAYQTFRTKVTNAELRLPTAAKHGLGKHLMAQDLLPYVRDSLQNLRDVADEFLQQIPEVQSENGE